MKMIQTDHVLEFDQIKQKWLELALTDRAKQEIQNTVPCLSESIGRKATRDKRSQRAIGKKRESAACFPRRDQRLHPNGGKGRLFIDLTAGRSGKSARCGHAAEALSEPLQAMGTVAGIL